jgi:hypothetical protein
MGELDGAGVECSFHSSKLFFLGLIEGVGSTQHNIGPGEEKGFLGGDGGGGAAKGGVFVLDVIDYGGMGEGVEQVDGRGMIEPEDRIADSAAGEGSADLGAKNPAIDGTDEGDASFAGEEQGMQQVKAVLGGLEGAPGSGQVANEGM